MKIGPDEGQKSWCTFSVSTASYLQSCNLSSCDQAVWVAILNYSIAGARNVPTPFNLKPWATYFPRSFWASVALCWHHLEKPSPMVVYLDPVWLVSQKAHCRGWRMITVVDRSVFCLLLGCYVHHLVPSVHCIGWTPNIYSRDEVWPMQFLSATMPSQSLMIHLSCLLIFPVACFWTAVQYPPPYPGTQGPRFIGSSLSSFQFELL